MKNFLAVKFTFAPGVAPGQSAICCEAHDMDFASNNVMVWAETELEAMQQALGIIHVRRLERAAGLEKGKLENALKQELEKENA